MNVEAILAQVDAFFEENNGKEAENLMLRSIAQAVEEQEDGCLLQLLNELIGYYRVVGRFEEAYVFAEKAIEQAIRMGLEGTIPYATTLLNAANVYRAGGRLEESRDLFLMVQDIYDRQLTPDNMLMASLQNNFSLLYQELGEFEESRKCLLRALEIVKKKEAHYEVGVTYANLAATCVYLGRAGEAEAYAEESMKVFDSIGAKDSHYGAALAALGAAFFQKADYARAREYYLQAAQLVEQGIGRTHDYAKLQENVKLCEEKLAEQRKCIPEPETLVENDSKTDAEDGKNPEGYGRQESHQENGLRLAEEYYETYGIPMLQEQFGDYIDKIAVGLAGLGSDCFGLDDALSRDHDWGPDFCLWVSDETWEKIGTRLQKAYEELPAEFKGYKRAPQVNGRNRRGVIKISDFWKSLVGTDSYEEINWRNVSDASLAAAVNGVIFRDEEGIMTAFRERLLQGYPEDILFLKIAEAAAGYAQSAQYNFPRMYQRGDKLTACMMAWEGIKKALLLEHYLEGRYPLHDKWLVKSIERNEDGKDVIAFLKRIADKITTEMDEQGAKELAALFEQLGEYFARTLYAMDIISDIDSYLDAHSEELVYKASLAVKTREELVQEIALLEFKAFDKVQNEGGRASCQNDWMTFSIMRKSQYLTWGKTMLMQYLYDFHREFARGHNLIEEKYGRMMESTAPAKYEKIKDYFPELSEDKRKIIEQICAMQVAWMEEFALKFPALADNARSIRTAEDNPFNTSYETYLRGELGTYSDKMLELYGRYIVAYAQAGRNPAYDIMTNSVHMYGYKTLEEAEEKTAKAAKLLL